MCELLEVSRSLVYYHLNRETSVSSKEEEIIEEHIKEIFRLSRNNYGTRKIKVELKKLGYQVSRKRISRLMRKNGLVSNYTVAHYKVHKWYYVKKKYKLNRENLIILQLTLLYNFTNCFA